MLAKLVYNQTGVCTPASPFPDRAIGRRQKRGVRHSLRLLLWDRKMDEFDSLTWHIMDAMADDWESIEQIQPHVNRFHGQVDDDQIFQILKDLCDNKLVKIMDGNGYGTDKFSEDSRLCWFKMTEIGKLLWDSEGYQYRDE